MVPVARAARALSLPSILLLIRACPCPMVCRAKYPAGREGTNCARSWGSSKDDGGGFQTISERCKGELKEIWITFSTVDRARVAVQRTFGWKQ